jgi:CspA family cold shock protein
MSSDLEVIVCQRCGRGILVTKNYRRLLTRRRVEVTVPVLCPTCFLREGPMPKEQGEVKWFDARKHYGFIVTDEGSEIFFHQQQILDADASHVQAGKSVRFHVRASAKGPEALNVKVIE